MKLPSSVKNGLSIFGAVLALFNLASILSLALLTSLFEFGGSYIGLFIYIILPGFMIFGLILIPIGMRIQRKKIKKLEKEGKELDWPILDFNKTTTRNATIIFAVGSVFLLIISSVGSYEAFHYTESVQFCGKLCHQVMEPEYTTYYGSAHERVACVECHVGAGANWYVKSKLSGLYQVYSVMAKKYPQPIPTPIANLRPAQETCEHCHWPEKFYDDKRRIKNSYLTDDENSEVVLHMLIKTSTKHTLNGIEKGIHQRISPDVIIEYKTSNPNRQEIPWVKYTNTKTGESYVYLDNDLGLSAEQIDSLETRVMDCLDCHNRPSHDYLAPQNFIDKSIKSAKISKTLPGIKMLAMQVLIPEYSTKDSAFMAIDSIINEYYKEGYPEIWETRSKDIKDAIAEIQDGYANNIFPYMKADWRVYPNNLGHMETDGCYRCHNDRHSTEAGRVISKDCNLCHNIVAQGVGDSITFAGSRQALEFNHPVDIGDMWQTELCSMCHSALY